MKNGSLTSSTSVSTGAGMGDGDRAIVGIGDELRGGGADVDVPLVVHFVFTNDCEVDCTKAFNAPSNIARSECERRRDERKVRREGTKRNAREETREEGEKDVEEERRRTRDERLETTMENTQLNTVDQVSLHQ